MVVTIDIIGVAEVETPNCTFKYLSLATRLLDKKKKTYKKNSFD
jgi:hypothetical protein